MGFAIIDISSGKVIETTETTPDTSEASPRRDNKDPESNPQITPVVPDSHIIEKQRKEEDVIRNGIFERTKNFMQE